MEEGTRRAHGTRWFGMRSDSAQMAESDPCDDAAQSKSVDFFVREHCIWKTYAKPLKIAPSAYTALTWPIPIVLMRGAPTAAIVPEFHSRSPKEKTYTPGRGFSSRHHSVATDKLHGTRKKSRITCGFGLLNIIGLAAWLL